MNKLLLLFILISNYSFAQLPAESDPHRGMYFDRFVKTKLSNSNEVEPAFSILSVDTNSDGIFEKEDAYLEYCCENHITYIALYDIGRITNQGRLAWNENTHQYEDLEKHLCRFIEKAKHQYGVTQVGLVGGSANAFSDIEDFMNRYPVVPGCNTCQADIDVLNVEYEFWGNNCSGELPNFIAIMNAMYNLKQSWNATHANNPLITEAYIAFIEYCTNPGVVQTAQIIDGCDTCSPFAGLTNPHPQKIDRVLYTTLGGTPANGFLFNEINAFENVATGDSTDLHPMFYSEGMNTSGTYDFYGPWLNSSPENNIFIAEDYFYYYWITHSGSPFGTPRSNDVQPGGAHWFAGSHMVGILDDPLTVITFNPFCVVNDSVHIDFHYQGPDEAGTDYRFYVKRDSDNVTVYPHTGGWFTGVSQWTAMSPGYRTINFADTLIFPALYLPKGNYTAHLELAYNHSMGCTYTSDFKFIVDDRPRLLISGDTAFCYGHQTFLTTTDHLNSTYQWYRNGVLLSNTSKRLKVTETGDYYCNVTGGDCTSFTDTIHITVHPLPNTEVFAVCNGNGTVTFKTNHLPANLSGNGYGPGGLNYYWNTGATTDQITVNSTASGSYRVQITDPYSGCSMYRDLSLPDPPSNAYTADITINHQPGDSCKNDGSLTAIINPAPGLYDPIRYYWSNGSNGQSIWNIPAGTYTVSMSVYGNACSYIKTVTIGTPPANAPALNAIVTPTSCFNNNGGSILLNPSGGNPPFQFEWNSIPDENGYSSVNEDQSNLFAGIYEVTVTDSAGCIFKQLFDVDHTDANITVHESTVTPVTGCGSNNNGTAAVIVGGGTNPYSLSWRNANGPVPPGGNSLSAGSYYVTATDAMGCTGSGIVHVPSVNETLTYEVLDSSRTSVICDSVNDGAFYICVKGGIMPYSVNSPWLIDTNMMSLINLYPGVYPFMISDANGCTLSDTLNIDTVGLSLALNAHHTTCIGCNNGSIDLLYSGGHPPYNITWNPQSGTLNGVTIEQMLAGSYTVCVTDSNQCMHCSLIDILDDPLNILTVQSGTEIIIYPNPSPGQFTIHIHSEKNEKLSFVISDVYGKKITEEIETNTDFVFDKTLAEGIYMISIENLGMGKFIISK